MTLRNLRVWGGKFVSKPFWLKDTNLNPLHQEAKTNALVKKGEAALDSYKKFLNTMKV